MSQKIDVNKIKSQIDDTKATLLIHSLGAEIVHSDEEKMVCTSICHNSQSHKLWFNKKTKGFYCHKEGQGWSLFDFVMKMKSLNFPQSIQYICNVCGFDYADNIRITEKNDNVTNWQEVLNKYSRYKSNHSELKIYDKSILEFFPKIYHEDWLDFGISIDTLEKYDIRYYPYQNAIVIPVFDENNNLVGIRGRFNNPRDLDAGRKYAPIMLLDGTMYNFPTNNIFFGVNHNIEAIRKHKKALLYEAEKGILISDTWFGEDNFTLASFGKNMNKFRRDWLIKQGVQEVIIGNDFDYAEYGDADYEEYEKNVFKTAELFKGYCDISVLCSHGGHKKKDSPYDNGIDRFMELWDNREPIVD